MTPTSSVALLLAAVLSGCASADLAGRALQAAGASKAPAAAARTVTLHLQAAQRLNLDARGRSLALVVRIYTLKDSTAFNAAPYSAFASPEAERAALHTDLLAVRELTLVPGQRVDVSEKLPAEASHIGVVALFHRPAAQRWRLSFDATDAARTGISIAALACSLSSAAGALAATPVAASAVAPARCQ